MSSWPPVDGSVYAVGDGLFVEVVETGPRRKLRLTKGDGAAATGGVLVSNAMNVDLLRSLVLWLGEEF